MNDTPKNPASRDKEESLIATVDLMEARRLHISRVNVPFRNCRTDLCDEMLGSGLPVMPR